MTTVGKFLVGGLIAANVALVGLLLFRDRSLEPAQAGSAAVPAAPTAEAVVPAPIAAPVVASLVPPQAAEPAPAAREATAPRRAERRVEPRREEPRARNEEWKTASLDPVRAEPSEPVREAPRPKPAPRAEVLTVPAGTNLSVQLDVGLHSRQVRTGDNFEASLDQDLVVDGKVVARAGSAATGRVTDVILSGRVKGREELKVTLVSVTLAGKSYPVETSTAGFVAEESANRDAAVIGGATAAGAIIGAIAKGGKGAATGAATGAAAGAGVVLSTRGKAIHLAAGSRLDFTMEEPVRVKMLAAPTTGDPDNDNDDSDAAPPSEPEGDDRSGGGIVRR